MKTPLDVKSAVISVATSLASAAISVQSVATAGAVSVGKEITEGAASVADKVGDKCEYTQKRGSAVLGTPYTKSLCSSTVNPGNWFKRSIDEFGYEIWITAGQPARTGPSEFYFTTPTPTQPPQVKYYK